MGSVITLQVAITVNAREEQELMVQILDADLCILEMISWL
jgi:hypothetical protein